MYTYTCISEYTYTSACSPPSTALPKLRSAAAVKKAVAEQTHANASHDDEDEQSFSDESEEDDPAMTGIDFSKRTQHDNDNDNTQRNNHASTIQNFVRQRQAKQQLQKRKDEKRGNAGVQLPPLQPQNNKSHHQHEPDGVGVKGRGQKWNVGALNPIPTQAEKAAEETARAYQDKLDTMQDSWQS